jgi:hypothetical protein
MFKLLSEYKGKRIVVELANGKRLSGTVIEVDRQNMRLETDQGTCAILISAIEVVWEKTSPSPAYQSMADQDKKIQPELEQLCTHMHARPCTMAFSQPCTQAYAQPCSQMYGQQPCTQAYACYQQFGYPCAQSYAQTCPQAFTPQPYEDPCYHRFGHFGRPCSTLFGGVFPGPSPYPYPPYPYPPYPYPPYPYPPYPYPYYNEQAPEGVAQQTQDKAGTGKGAGE